MKKLLSKTNNFKYDLPAGIVVLLVALPLCLGIALASGAPLFSGIIAGIIGGMVVSLISGSHMGVSGPAAGLVVIVLSAIQELGDFRQFLCVVMIAGGVQLLLGFMRTGLIAYYFPASVIKGMLTAIGIIIILKQIPHAVGYSKNPELNLSFSKIDGLTTLSELVSMLDFLAPGPIIISLVSLIILIVWGRIRKMSLPLLSLVPESVVAVTVAILLNILFERTGAYFFSPEHVVDIPVADSIRSFFAQFDRPDFLAFANPRVYMYGVLIAVVASLESLLCLEATDKLDPQKRISPVNLELKAQGVGNLISGFLGGIPVAQVIVRSSTNIQAGARSWLSSFFHGILLLLFAMAIPKILNMIPLACLACILLVVGYKLASPDIFREMHRKGRQQFIAYVATIAGIVFTNLLMGIGIGLVVSLIYLLWETNRHTYHFEAEGSGPAIIRLAEQLTFLNKAEIMETINRIPDGVELIIDLSRTRSMHRDIREILQDFKDNAEKRGIQLTMKGWRQHQVISKHVPKSMQTRLREVSEKFRNQRRSSASRG